MVKIPKAEHPCNEPWLPSYPEVRCQLETGHKGMHEFRNKERRVWWKAGDGKWVDAR